MLFQVFQVLKRCSKISWEKTFNMTLNFKVPTGTAAGMVGNMLVALGFDCFMRFMRKLLN